MRRINPNLYPKSGFIFKEPDGTTIAGHTWDGVVARVQSYRKRNNLPPGDPKREVMDQACAANPELCKEENELAKAQLKVSTLKGRMLAWMAHLRQKREKQGIAFVPQEEADKRARVCKRCPMRKEIPEGCSSCRAALVALRKDILGDGKAIDGELAATGCVVLGNDLATAIHLDQPVTDNPELPPECWRKKTL